MKVVVLAGGLSTERDVSFVTGNMVSKALRKNGHRVILLDLSGDEETGTSGCPAGRFSWNGTGRH